jgi:hypothetical protein
MEIIGKLIKKLPPVTGESAKGPWKKQSFVIETQADFPKSVCFTTWGDKVELNSFTESDIIKVHFDVESREYKDNWYSDLKCWKIELNASGGSTNTISEIAPLSEKDIPFELEDDPGDDLPF